MTQSLRSRHMQFVTEMIRQYLVLKDTNQRIILNLVFETTFELLLSKAGGRNQNLLKSRFYFTKSL